MGKFLFYSAVGLCLSLLSGCIWDADPTGSAPDLPENFLYAKFLYDTAQTKDAASVQKDNVPSQEVANFARWADNFGAPELSKFERMALSGNFDIADAYAKILQADSQTMISGAPLFPTLNGTSNGSHDVTSGQTRGTSSNFLYSTNNSNISHSNLVSYGLSASYMLDFWGQNRASADAARLTAKASRFDRDVVALTTAANVATNYFTILATREKIAIATQNIASATRILEAIKARQKVGTATGIDVAEQENLLATQKASLPALKITLQQTQSALALLLGTTPETLALTTKGYGRSLFSLRLPKVQIGLPGQLLARRPDIAKAEAALASNKELIAAARAAYLPNITLNASDGHQSSVLKTLFNPQAAFSNTAVALTEPLFTGFQLDGQLALQQGKYKDALVLYQKSIVQALVDVDNGLVAVRQNADYETAEREAVRSAKIAFEGTEQRLHQGTIDITTLLTTQQSLFNAEEALIQARVQRLQAYVALYQALGGGFDKSQYDDNGVLKLQQREISQEGQDDKSKPMSFNPLAWFAPTQALAQ